jgi:hypothetical protein
MTAIFMTAPSWRYVTAAEQDLAREVFGSAIETRRVRMFCQPLVTAPFTPGSWGVVWPVGWGLEDFATGDPDKQGDFIHEMTHVWQAQHGVNLVLGKLRALDLYDYDDDLKPDANGVRPTRDTFPADRFPKLNIEQQARFVEHAFLAQRHGRGRRPSSYYAPGRQHWYRP